MSLSPNVLEVLTDGSEKWRRNAAAQNSVPAAHSNSTNESFSCFAEASIHVDDFVLLDVLLHQQVARGVHHRN